MNIPFKWCFDIANIYIFNSISTKIKLIINSILELLNYCSPLIFFIIKDKINNQVASTLFEKINAYIKQVYAVLYSVLILTLLTINDDSFHQFISNAIFISFNRVSFSFFIMIDVIIYGIFVHLI